MISSDERTVVTAAADSVITFWVDSTEAELLAKATKQAELVNMCVIPNRYMSVRPHWTLQGARLAGLLGVGRLQERYPSRALYGSTAPSRQPLQSRISLLCPFGYFYSERRRLHLQ